MTTSDRLGRYELEQLGDRDLYVNFAFSHSRDYVKFYTYAYGYVGFEPFALGEIEGDDILNTKIDNVVSLGYVKTDDTDVPRTEKSADAIIDFYSWLGGAEI